MQQLGLSDREINKTFEDLVRLHKIVLKHYLCGRKGWSFSDFRKFSILYDKIVTMQNYRDCFHWSCEDFVNWFFYQFREYAK